MFIFNNLQIKTRLNIFQNLVIVLVFIILGIYIVNTQTKNIISETDDRMSKQLDILNDEINLQIKENQKKVDLSLNLAHQMFYLTGKLTEKNETIQIKAVNQITKKESQQTLKKWEYNNVIIHENNEFVDKLKELNVETATIFQKIDEGFIRISTTVTKENGERAIGTFIPNESPVIQTIMKGETYRGRAFVVKDWYLTAYEPIYINNEIKGILYVGVNEKDMSMLKDALLNKNYFDAGYAFLFDSKGKMIIHPDDSNGDYAEKETVDMVLKANEKQGKIELNETNDVKMIYYKYSQAIDSYLLIKIDKDKILSKVNNISIAIIIAFLISISLILIVNSVLSNSIIKALDKGIVFSNQIANGNLKAELDITQKDEIGILSESLKIMAKRMCNIISEINEYSESINMVGNQMKIASQNISQGASEQASSTEEISSAIEEMATTISQNSENAQLTQNISAFASQNIKEVSKAVDKSNEEVKEISSKISLINDIAFQTNILALNAAVEAARAGEQGKGFAVVAAEVRKLAERSRKASDDITQLIKTNVIQNQNSKILLDKLIPEVEKTNKLVTDITESSFQQNIGALQVSTAIQQLNNVVQQNASASEELASTADELASQANNLIETISFFKNNSQKKS